MPDFSRAYEFAFHHPDLIACRECGRARQGNGAIGAVVHAHRHSICIALLRVLFDLAAGDRASGPEERDRSATSPDRLLAGAWPACRRSGTARFIAQLAARFNSFPAAGSGFESTLWVGLLVFVILLVTDILGFTKVFSFTRPAK